MLIAHATDLTSNDEEAFVHAVAIMMPTTTESGTYCGGAHRHVVRDAGLPVLVVPS